MDNIEVWKQIEGYPGYEISNFGRVKSSLYYNGTNERILKQRISKGYCRVLLIKDKGRYSKQVHRLVGLAFIGNPENKPQINHKDGVKTNNHVDNLEWATAKENRLHAAKNGLTAKGERNANSKLTEEDIIKIRSMEESQRNIAAMFGVSHTLIRNIRRLKTWKHVTDKKQAA